jgi:hypothetical protein
VSLTPTEDDVPVPSKLDLPSKAGFVIDGLRAAALRVPYGFDQHEVEEIWGTALDSFPIQVLMLAVARWIGTHDTFPTLAEFIPVAQLVSREMREEVATDPADCPECEGRRYVLEPMTMVTLVGKDKLPTEVESHYMRPCGTCLEMQNRHDLWMRGHFAGDHKPCAECRMYYPKR